MIVDSYKGTYYSGGILDSFNTGTALTYIANDYDNSDVLADIYWRHLRIGSIKVVGSEVKYVSIPDLLFSYCPEDRAFLIRLIEQFGSDTLVQ